MKKKIGKLMVAISIIALAVSGVAQAQPIDVPNFSFELDQNGDARPWPVLPANWAGTANVTADLIGWNGTDPGSWNTGSDGRHSTLEWNPDGFFRGFAKNGEYIWQVLDKTIIAGEEYLLTFNAAGHLDVEKGNVYAALIYGDAATQAVEGELTSELKTTTGTHEETWEEFTVLFTAQEEADYIGKNLGIKFTSVDSVYTLFDNVRLERVLVSNPDPYDGETDVLAATNLGWELKSVVTNCDVYFGTDPDVIANPKVVDAENVVFYDPPVDLDPDTIYYWRVDAYIGTEVYEGYIWEFTTESIISEDPCGLTVDTGDTAVFRVKAMSGSTYLWKKLDSPDPPDNAGSTLTIDNVQKANEGVYYCRVTKLAFMADSAKVKLMTRRLVARWEFDDESLNAKNDEGATCWLGDYVDPNTENPDPTVVYAADDPCTTGSGKSLQLAADELHVQITGSEDFFNFYPQGYTLNAWVKTVQSDWGCVASKQDKTEPDYYGWVLNCGNGGNIWTGLREVGEVYDDNVIDDDQWHMVTATYDAEAGVITAYVDGEPVGSDTSTDIASTNAYPVVFGAEFTDGQVAYEGRLDKISIYSYGLSPLEVAVLYTDVMTGELICLEQPVYDLNDDCRVDLLDFAKFAADWLECSLVPDCLP